MNVRISSTLLLGLVIVCLCSLSCSSDSNPLAPSSLEGTYDLVSITDEDGNVVSEEITEGILVLTKTTFTLTFVITINGSPNTISDTWTYTISGSEMTLTDSDDDSFTVTISISGKRLNIKDDEGDTLAFDKR